MSKQINFTIVPDESDTLAGRPRVYANFCAVAHTPFDLTLTFCEVRPLSEPDVAAAESSQTVKVPVVVRVALPFGVVPGLIAALQDQLRIVQQDAQAASTTMAAPKGPPH